MVRWELISFVNRSSQRKKILSELNRTITPSQLAKTTGMYLTHVSRTLGELCKKGLVECLTPSERVEKYYRITKLGRDVLKDMEEMKE
jgi:predicted transcriptional regulator